MDEWLKAIKSAEIAKARLDNEYLGLAKYKAQRTFFQRAESSESFALMVSRSSESIKHKPRSGVLRPYIINGDVDIHCGPIVNQDSGYAGILAAEDKFNFLHVRLDENQTRGPPSTEYMVNLGERKLVRTVFIIGKVKSFHAPPSVS